MMRAAHLCLSLLGITGGKAASMNVHSLIGLRAHAYYAAVQPMGMHISSAAAAAYNSAIADNLPAVLGGADFPDFLYACGSYADHHDAGEVAHWPTFHAAAVRYLQRTARNFSNPSSWSDDTKKLVAFIFGVSVHYVTDELWEGLSGGLGSARGFTEMVDAFTAGNNGHGNTAESIANMGGDFYAAWSLDESNLNAWDRFFPVDHLVNIYHETPKNATANFTDVTRLSLQECKPLFDLGLWALKTFGALLYPIYNHHLHHLPFITEKLFDNHISGIDDMAAYTTFAWQRLACWMSTSAPLDPPPRLSVRERAAADDEDDRSTHNLFRRLAPLLRNAEAARGLTPSDMQAFFSVVELPTPSQVNTSRRVAATSPQSSGPRWRLDYHGPTQHSDWLPLVMTSLVEHFMPGQMSVAIGTPRKQRPTASRPAAPNVHLNSKKSSLERASSAVALTGTALASADFDLDGLSDLAVGSPGAGVKGLCPRAGRVIVHYGNGTDALVGEGNATSMRFGETFAVLDFNLDGVDDLAVGAPGSSDWNATDPIDQPYRDNAEASFRLWGKVFVYFGVKGRGLAPSPLVLRTSTEFTALGDVLSAADVDGDGKPDLIVGCPSANDNAGRVLAFASSPSRMPGAILDVDATGVAILDISGSAYDRFGQSIAVVGSTLVVGAPFHRPNASCNMNCQMMGSIYGFALAGPSVPKTPPLQFRIVGDVELGEFGYSVAVNSTARTSCAGEECELDTLRSVLVVSTPDASNGIHLRSGQVSLFASKDIVGLRGIVPISNVPLLASISGVDAHGALGASLAWEDVDGDGWSDLIVGAPRTSHDSLLLSGRETGALYVWHGASLPKGKQTVKSATFHHFGSRPRGQMGASFALLANGSGISLAVGSPRSTVDGLEQAGAVDVLQVF